MGVKGYQPHSPNPKYFCHHKYSFLENRHNPFLPVFGVYLGFKVKTILKHFFIYMQNFKYFAQHTTEKTGKKYDFFWFSNTLKAS